MSLTLSTNKTRELSGLWDQAIYDTEERLQRVEAKARRLREAIQTFKDSKANGDQWPGTATPLRTQSRSQSEESATQC